MKKILFILLISTVASFGKTKGVPSKGKMKDASSKSTPKPQIVKPNIVTCIGWTDIVSNTTGEVIGKRSNNCWNASQGFHRVTILYQL
jgi:hypothetical protein